MLIEGIIIGTTGIIIYTLIVYLFCEGTYIFQPNNLKKALLLILIYGIGFLAVALFEESLIRGYILQKLLKKFSRLKSIMISSAIFGGLHFFAYSSSYYVWVGIINASVMGILLAFMVIKTNSLMMAVGFHLSWNLTQQILFINNIFNYNVSVNFKIREGLLSGTYFVPESGLAVSIVLLVIGIYIFVRFRQEKVFDFDFVER